MSSPALLPAPCRYFPLAHGRYDVAAGLRPLGADFGNGAQDGKVFQFDAGFPRYRESKLRARAERLEKYYPPSHDFTPRAEEQVVRFIIETLVREWPALFRLTGEHVLECTLTSERLVFDAAHRLLRAEQSQVVLPPYRDALDALASQLQEDLAVWHQAPDGSHEWLAAIHLCHANHWAAQDKIGRPFNHVHQPVADFGKLAAAAPALVDRMVTKGPFVRFAWGVAADCLLNHHPQNADPGRAFDPAAPALHLRIERQTLSPFPAANASLFTIRTFFLDCARDLSAAERDALARAIGSMSPAALAYKGLTASREAILVWLASLDPDP